MAATLTLNTGARTPTRLVYRFHYNGTSGTGTGAAVDNDGGVTPDFQTDSLEGQLANLLATPVANQAAARLLLFANPRLKISQRKMAINLPSDASGMCGLDADVHSGKATLVLIGPGGTDQHDEDITLEFCFAVLTTTG